ncbi:MAG: CHASE2 domain-containing protein [Planktothrix sp.]|uniref:CHASE2 domain-containing protein n=1 Tax=Planktothrix sp. TaxID=3088171 RepID=UPI0038D3F43E
MTEKLVIIDLGKGSLTEGFPLVTARLSDLENPRPIKITGCLPPAPELIRFYQRWRFIYQELYHTLGIPSRIELEQEDITHVSEVELQEICIQYIHQFNQWLHFVEFRTIDQQLRSLLQPTDEIQIILETSDFQVRHLPWQLWYFFHDYPRAELALSQPQYTRKASVSFSRSKIRILAILGNKTGIDIAEDQKILTALPQTETFFLIEPDPQQIDQALWDEKGWDILFFAGHSESQDLEESGTFKINHQDKVSIKTLLPAFRKAIEKGLQIAIFNSCDGLGLATELAQLNIPQTIVMREPVPDLVAQTFLKHFLQEFSQGQSLYLAVRQARERLYILENRFPCGSWLPVIFQNPASIPVRWQELRHRKNLYQLPSFGLTEINKIGFISLIITVLICLIRQGGWLHFWELKFYDAMMRSRPIEKQDHRLLLVTASETDIQALRGWTVSDQILTQFLQKLAEYKPRTIGLNLYRNLPVEPGYQNLINQFKTQDNLFLICKKPDQNDSGLAAPPAAPPKQVGFNDVMVDSDHILRRQLLFMSHPQGCQTKRSLAIQLAFHYLKKQGIQPQNIPPDQIKLGNLILKPMGSDIGFYPKSDRQVYQIMLNYRLSEPIAPEVTFTQILNGEVDPNLVKDKLVLVGVNATSVKDEGHRTSYSPDQEVRGLMIQAQMVSHLLSAVLDDRPLLTVWSKWIDALWIGFWTLLGGVSVLLISHRTPIIITLGTATAVLYGVCWGLFLVAIWVPFIPALLGLVGAGVWVWRLQLNKKI